MDDIPWIIGYSGGKDSTAAVQIVWMALKDLPFFEKKKAIHIINTDTLVESPVISKWAQESLKKMQMQSDRESMPFVTHVLHPSYDDSFWVNLLGKGYPYPRKKFRWCTDRLKIQPVNNFIKSQIAEHGEVILVIGTRKAESASRKRHMENLEAKRVRELLSPNPTLANEYVFSPLENWSDEDVWAFLMQYKNPWDHSNKDLLTLYRGATADNECPIMYEKDLPSCGKSRFGCWVCTMVERDKSMEAMISNDEEKEWMAPLLAFRDEFAQDEDNDRKNREFRRRDGNLKGSYLRLFHGPYKKDKRQEWVRKLLEVQEEVNDLCPKEYGRIELITLSELQAIRRIWVNEYHEFEDSLPTIYQEATGKPFEDPTWLGVDNFGKNEWDVLKAVCDELYPDEKLLFEMAYRLVDLEAKAFGQNNRNGLLKEIENSVHRTFYKDEDDAMAFYLEKQKRKKEKGGEYNEKFFEEYKKSKESSADEESEEPEEDENE